MSFYTCQDDGLLPLCSLDVFRAVCFWGSCEAATFNKHSLPLSKPLSQTNSMIKRHTWGDPRGNLHSRLSFCATLFIHFSLSYVFYLLGFPFSSEWKEYFVEDTSFVPLIRLQWILCDIMSWQFTTLLCEAFHFLRPSDLSPFHQPHVLLFISLNFTPILNTAFFLSCTVIAGKKNTSLLRSVFTFFPHTGWVHLHYKINNFSAFTRK